MFTVYAPRGGQKIAYPHPDVASIVWQIKASQGYFRGAHVEGFQLAYGKVPEGYTQTVPSQPQVAPPLSSRLVYSFFAETSDAPTKDGFFYMSGTGPIQTAVPDLCLALVDGRETRVNCKTNQPYQEPANLEEIVLENRTRR